MKIRRAELRSDFSQPLLDEQTVQLSVAGWQRAKADARAFWSGGDPARLLAEALWVGDVLIGLLAAITAYYLREGVSQVPTGTFVMMLLAIGIATNVLYFSGAYAAPPDEGFASQMSRGFKAWCVALIVLMVIGYVTKTSAAYSRLWIVTWFGLALCGFAVLRALSIMQAKRWGRQGRLVSIVAIVEFSDGGGRELLGRLQTARPGRLHLLGLFSGMESDGQRKGVDDLVALSRLFRIDEVLIVVSGLEEVGLAAVLRKLGGIPTNVRIYPWAAERAFPVRDVGLFQQSPVLTIHRKPINGWGGIAKRVEDVVLASVFIVLLAPVMLLIALLVKFTSKGPVLFRQQRLGFNNNIIVVLKFRTMKHQSVPVHGVPQATRGDSRVTRIGRILRRLSLDELPQLINVIRGDMSLVGPRPHALAHNEQYVALIDDYLGRHRVQPGITGWAQVNGLRGETDTLEKMQRRVECDLDYIDNWSVLLDIRIMFVTAFSLLFDRNAY
jgi:Undecaprenyl-phosphate glucose phosphotransferase